MTAACARVVRVRSYVPLAMTGRATGQLGRRSNVAFRRQPLADFRLIVRGFPIHIKTSSFFSRKTASRIAMAVQAPLHQERVGLKHQRHLVDLAVAGGAADAFVDVNAVIEIGEIGQAMHFHPLDGFVGAVAVAHRLEVAGVVVKHGMAVHARLRWRNAGDRGGFHAGVAVAAIDAVVADVMLMAELHGLLTGNVLARQIG